MKRRHFLSGLVTAGTLHSALGSRLSALALQGDAAAVTRVLVVFKCHLDVGFDDTQAAIMQLYFDDFFPRAIEIGEQMSQAGGDRYVWTTGSWMLYEYLEHASAEQRKRAEKAIAAGHLAWHALPFTWQTEMLDRTMIAGSIGFSKSLDQRYGRTTTGAKMTDVPGHTRGIIAPLQESGVTFLHIGINSASTPAEVPRLFVWKDGNGGELTVMYHPDYGGTFAVPGSGLAVAIEVRDDNSGPHTPDEIAAIYKKLRATFPNATITASSMTDVAVAMAPYRAQLPVLTQEIGDTWIHGVPSDPVKICRYREVARFRRELVDEGKLHPGDAVDLALLRRLTLAVEHGTGADTKKWLDYDHYKPSDLVPVLALPGYRTMTTSWAEKRQDIDEGVANLPQPLRTLAQKRLDSLQATPPLVAGLKPHATDSAIETQHFTVTIDPLTGAISGLREKAKERDWATAKNPLGLYSYQTFSKQDFDRFIASYIHSTEDWAFKDFGKPGIDRFGAQSREWAPTLVHLWSGANSHGYRVLAELRVNDAETEKLGTVAWPRTMFFELILPNDAPVVEMNFYWFGKVANRLPEAAWLSFHPAVPSDGKWLLGKTDEWISPFDVVPGGNRHMHAIISEMRCPNFTIESLDAPVVALGVKSPIYFTREQPDLGQGLHFCLHNNTWGTNYVQWFGGDMRFRFVLRPNAV
jgi:Domain of unknown function (DUF5054)